MTFERHSANDDENFVTTHVKAAVKCISTKPRINAGFPGNQLQLEEKWDNQKKVSLLSKRNPTNANALKFKKVQKELKCTQWIQG